ncbi:MAG: RIP metalloprotease RseP [Sulfurospirillaceae bacterium]|nr:RIP metalloprotease RseP [Sulfurospirillaceae bacterium]
MGTLVAFLVISFLVFFHEAGHFLAAKFFGVKVEVFSIGFGKKLLIKNYKGTQYCFSMIPLGGYVQMKGQDDSNPTLRNFDNDSYNTKSPWQRIMILFAGPFANFLLAFLLYIIIALNGVSFLAPIVGGVTPDSPAFIAGFQQNDKVVMINQQEISTWNDLSKIIQKTNEPLTFKIERNNAIHTIHVTPKLYEAKTIFGEVIQKPMIGISSSKNTVLRHFSPLEAISYAYEETLSASLLIVQSLQKFIQGVVSPKELGGIISIVKVTSDASEVGIIALFYLTALISVNLGVLNLLPIPALDGGHILLNIYEVIARKSPSEKVLYGITVVGWIFLLSLTAFTIFNDIYRLTGGYQ